MAQESESATVLDRLRPVAFFALVLLCITPWGSPPLALALGILLALTLGNPYAAKGKQVSARLLQISVVLLGFMLATKLVHAGSCAVVSFSLSCSIT